MRDKTLRAQLIGAVPFEYQLWNARQCAEHLEQPLDLFMNKIRLVHSFPPRIPKLGRLRWRAMDVAQWKDENPDIAEALKPRDRHGVTALYRHYDADDVLLYVGISLSAARRMSDHRTKSRWFDTVATIRIERFPTRRAAQKAERMAIKKERPKFNFHMNERVRYG